MLYIDLFRDAARQEGFHRLNSSYSEAQTIELANLELAGKRFPWARAYEVVNDQADILAVGIKSD